MMRLPLTNHLAPSSMRLFQTFCIACLPLHAIGFTAFSRQHCAFQTVLSNTRSYGGVKDESSGQRWLNCGLLLSSWTDGVVDNPEAKAFLKKGLVCSLLADLQRNAEASVESSVLQSPCCGPDTEALQNMESVDATLAKIQKDPNAIQEWLEYLNHNLNLRVLYIPTAMYALRADSTNTPGKQRQRARADGKKRRAQVVECIQGMFPENVNVITITLDLDDGSVKQPEGSDNASDFPKDGRTALCEWFPNLIYVEGGNTFWLHHCMTKGDWTDDLVTAITTRNAVYCGKSAGAILVGRSAETATWKGWDDPSVVPGMETYEDWKGVRGLDLVGGVSFFPHMSDEWTDLICERQEELGEVVYCLQDEKVCLVEGDAMSVVSAGAVPTSQI